MIDRDYIPAGDRRWHKKAIPPNGYIASADVMYELLDSHAVADDVMRELAEAIRIRLAHEEERFPIEANSRMRRALARYDALIGGSDE